MKIIPSKNIHDKVLTFGGKFESGLSSVLYEDEDVILSWNSNDFNPIYNIKTDWGWHDAMKMKVDGNSSNRAKVKGVGGDVSDTQGAFYFTPNGERLSALDHENYGSYSFNVLTTENYNENIATYLFEVVTGKVGSGGQGTYMITKIKN